MTRHSHWIAPVAAVLLVVLGTRAPPASGDDACGRAGDFPSVTWPLAPEGRASFGAARSGHWLYVLGGHTGRPHTHSRENIASSFLRLNLLDRATWETLPAGPLVQGTALVAHAGRLIRVGGMHPRNATADEDADLVSLASVGAYEPAKRKWSELPPLPCGLSSHDAVVHGDRVFVAGGWTLNGSEDPKWSARSFAMDLASENPAWKEIAAPGFTRRALVLAAHGDSIYVIGGLDEDGAISRRVDVYSVADDAWSRGPDLPGPGFGASAFGTKDGLFAADMKGSVYRLADDGSVWKPWRRLAIPRFFGRLVPVDDGLLAVGGAGWGGHRRLIESVPTQARSPNDVHVSSWTIPTPARAKNRQGMSRFGSNLLLYGGNRSLGQHDFEKDDFLSEAFWLQLGTLRFRPAPAMPVSRQSMVALDRLRVEGGHGGGASQTTLMALGGFGHDGEVARTWRDALIYNVQERTWTRQGNVLPEGRSQFVTIERKDGTWLFGGVNYDPRREKKDRFRYPRGVLRVDTEKGVAVKALELETPGPRRAFGGAAIGDVAYFVGGMGESFSVAEDAWTFDFKTKTFGTIPAPARPRISPQVVAVKSSLYVCAGSSPSKKGGFEPNPTLEVFDPEARTWRVLLDSVPIVPRHLRMFAYRDRLWLYSAHHKKPHMVTLAVIDLP